MQTHTESKIHPAPRGAASPRVYWLLAGSKHQASSRLHGYLIHEHLCKSGWQSVILFSPYHVISDMPPMVAESVEKGMFREGDVVLIQKFFGPNTRAAMRALKARKIHTIYVDCDLPLKLEEASLASLAICPSAQLASFYRDRGIASVTTLPEMYEACRPPRISTSPRLRCVWFGCMDPRKAIEVRDLRELIQANFPEYELVVISNRMADHIWKLPEAWDLVSSCDVAVLTGNESQFTSAKSANRLIQAMALGLPVLASPLPSYRSIIRHGRNALLCEGRDQWIEALRAIGDVQFRTKIAFTGHRYARRYFSPHKIGPLWQTQIENVVPAETVHHRGPLSLLERVAVSRLQAACLGSLARDLKPAADLQRAYHFGSVRKRLSLG